MLKQLSKNPHEVGEGKAPLGKGASIMTSITLLLMALMLASNAASNSVIESFTTAKKNLEKDIYFDHRITIYCNATFDENNNITKPDGYSSSKYEKRSKRVEWEHVVPAENFGSTFSEWRDGHDQCINNKGKAYKGRRCANKSNQAYRFMQADLYKVFL